MNRRDFFRTGLPLAAVPLVLSSRSRAQSAASPVALPAAGADGWVSLMNFRDLSGWYTMLQRSGRGVAEKRGMVTFEDGMLHILGNEVTDQPAESGYVATLNDFENVHIRVEYKWGEKRFPPRTLTKRDNGVLYGLVGADKVWPTTVECQIEEDDVGDAYLLGGVRCVQNPHSNGLFAGAPGEHGWSRPNFRPGAARHGGRTPAEPTSARKIKDGNFESLHDWNTVEVMWQGDRAAHIVNGRVVNVLSRLQQPDPQHPGQFLPLTKGKIAIELEYSEIWYRRVEVRSLV